MTRFVRECSIDATADDLYRWHARPGAFERLSPPWERVEIVEDTGGIADGARKVIRVGRLGLRWVAVHEAHVEGCQFVDVQTSGPFKTWAHTHRFVPDGRTRSKLVDEIEYQLPLGSLGEFVAGRSIAKKLVRMFAWRHRTTQADLAAHSRAEVVPMRVAITGASGLLGRGLTAFLTTGGHTVVALTRKRPYEEQGLDACDAIVHLAGETISQRWNTASKARIGASRVDGTRALCEAIARCQRTPRVLVCASAVGIYGDRGDAELDETSAPGTGFLADVCRAWEAAADPARAAGVRVVHARFAPILTPAGGALNSMLVPFRLGLGARFGSGAQWMPWVSIDDAIGAVHCALTRSSIVGPMNVVAPDLVTNREFTRTLGRVLHRPALLTTPRFAARILFGEMAEPLFFASARVNPRVLASTDYVFRDPTLAGALAALLGRAPAIDASYPQRR